MEIFRTLCQWVKRKCPPCNPVPMLPEFIFVNSGIGFGGGGGENVYDIKMSEFSYKSVHIGSQKISYVQEGSGPDPVLLLPGALGTAVTDFGPNIRGINSKNALTVIAWDPPGYGQSVPEERTFPDKFFDRDAKMAIEFMKHLGYRQFHAAGWSDGGITAMIMAAEQPQVIKKMVLWGANSYLSQEDITTVNQVRDVSKWSERMRKPMENMYGVEGFPKLWEMWCQSYERYFNQYRGEICAQRLDKIKCPTLIIHGDKDIMVDPVHPGHLNKHIDGSILKRFPDGKHNLHFKYQKEFNQMVETFLTES